MFYLGEPWSYNLGLSMPQMNQHPLAHCFFLYHTVLQGNVKSCKMFKVSSIRSIDLRSIEFSESDLNRQ